MLSLPGSACLLSTTVILVGGCPGTTLCFLLGNAALLIAFGDVIGVPPPVAWVASSNPVKANKSI